MNILVIESSPHKHGSSNLLADQFIKGAKESGHQVTVLTRPARIFIRVSAVISAV